MKKLKNGKSSKMGKTSNTGKPFYFQDQGEN